VSDEPVETIELTSGLFQALLNMTGGDPDLHEAPKRALVRRLHEAKCRGTAGRWVVEVTREDLEAIRVHLLAYCLRRPDLELRFENTLCRQSGTYKELLRKAKETA
jgi:hypothetical protein